MKKYKNVFAFNTLLVTKQSSKYNYEVNNKSFDLN